MSLTRLDDRRDSRYGSRALSDQKTEPKREKRVRIRTHRTAGPGEGARTRAGRDSEVRGPEPRGAPRTRKAKRDGVDGAATASPSVASPRARSLAITIAVAGLEKKAIGLEVLDVAGKVDYADFLVLMTGRSDRQVVALAQGIEEEVKKRENQRPLSVEGLPHAHWVLLDYGDVVVHVFQDDARGLYDLDGLWMDARRI